MKQTRFATLCVALGLASFLTLSSHAQITVDGTRDAGYGTQLSVQAVTSAWGSANTVASLSAVQEGGSLLFLLQGELKVMRSCFSSTPSPEAFRLFPII